MTVQLSAPIALAGAARRIDSSAIRDLLHVIDRPDVISLAGGLPAAETFPTEELGAAMNRILASDPSVLQYSPTEGIAPLRQWVAARHGVDPGQVVITHGSQQALDLVARALLDPGAAVALADPAYVGAVQVLRLAGAQLIPVAADSDGLRVDDLEARLRRGERPALVYVVANFDNPTGATLSSERRAALAALADRYGFVIVDDDPYGELRWRGSAPASLASMTDRVITLGTVSKVVCPGLRVGYLVAPTSVAPALVLVKQALDLHTSTLAQHALHDLLTAPGFLDRQLDRLRGVYRERAAALSEALRAEFGDRLRFRPPDGGMFVWGELVDVVDTQELLAAAIERGVAFVPGEAFAVAADHHRALRLSFATNAPDQLAEGVRRLAVARRDLR
ncbi:MAG TPA: PLP-dependent aminotransferase family protein [Acidimicrobiales bacterium]|nr:PLP-dependent aminotransferase family protein [Acidimicrobiales bacterium]